MINRNNDLGRTIMAYERSSFYKRLREDIEHLQDRGAAVRVGLLDRIRVKRISPEKLHANPEDEFSMPQIGPNDAIINNYCNIARRNYSLGEQVFSEPIVVLKLQRDGYLILNGHHRWAGALRAGVPKVRIQIENPN